MLRKQVYLRREHDRKVKALAARRGCTEAEIIREALDRLPNPDGWLDQLRADGIFAHTPAPRVSVEAADADAIEAERLAFEAWLDEERLDLRLSQAVDEDRGPR